MNSSQKLHFIIRKAIKKDFRQFDEVNKESFHDNYFGILDYYDRTENIAASTEWDRKNYFRKDKDKEHIYVAEKGRELLGYIILFTHAHRTWIYDIFVKKRYQGKGIGTALTRHAMKNKKKVFLTVNERNKKAIIFFKKFGFKPILEDMLMMEKRRV